MKSILSVCLLSLSTLVTSDDSIGAPHKALLKIENTLGARGDSDAEQWVLSQAEAFTTQPSNTAELECVTTLKEKCGKETDVSGIGKCAKKNLKKTCQTRFRLYYNGTKSTLDYCISPTFELTAAFKGLTFRKDIYPQYLSIRQNTVVPSHCQLTREPVYIGAPGSTPCQSLTPWPNSITRSSPTNITVDLMGHEKLIESLNLKYQCQQAAEMQYADEPTVEVDYLALEYANSAVSLLGSLGASLALVTMYL